MSRNLFAVVLVLLGRYRDYEGPDKTSFLEAALERGKQSTGLFFRCEVDVLI
jgi:hypothetical protein